VRNLSRGWRVTHLPPPRGVSRARWLFGNLWRKLLWITGLHWKQRKVRLTWARFHRLMRARMIEDHVRWDHVLRRDPCVYCGRHLPFEEMTVEHVQPRSKRGPDTARNKVGACASCNRRRGARPLLSFLLAEHHQQRYWAPRNAKAFARSLKRRVAEMVDRTAAAPVLRVTLADRIAAHDAQRRQPTDVDMRRMR
jgi:hypothetical protein